jgi:hippurate hydrolase
VLTVGSLRAGGASNVIPDQASLGVTVRAHSDVVLDRITAAVDRVVRAECAASGAPDPEITIVSRSPVNLPDRLATAAVRSAHEAFFGVPRVGAWPPSMATEDFPLFGDAGAALHGYKGVPTVYWLLGMVGPEQWAAAGSAGLPANHSPHFAPQAGMTLRTGISAMIVAALAYLGA